MKWIPKYQKAGSINKGWVRDRDINGNWGYRNFKTGQFRITLPNSQEERQQERNKNNTAVLKQYSADSARYNRELVTRKNHSDETIKKVISKPSLVMRNDGKTTIVRSKELAPGEDSAKLNTTIEEQIPIFKGFNLVTGLGKLALSKMGQNAASHWARNSLLNETAGNLTKNISKDALTSTTKNFLNKEIQFKPTGNYVYLNNTYTQFKGTYPKLNHHLQGEDAVKMFKEYGGTPIPEGSINGDQLRMYVNEARERYGLMGNNNISDEEIAQALYKHTNELGKGSAAVNSQGEPQLLFRGDTKAYTQLKDHPSPTKLVDNSGTMDNSLGTLFTGEFPGTMEERFDAMGSSRYLDGWNFNPTLNKWQWRGSGIKSNFNKQEGYLMFSHLHPNHRLAQRGQYVGFKKAVSTPEHPNDLNVFIVRTPAMRDATREISVLNDDFLVLQPTFKTNRFKWDTSKERIVDTSGKIDDVIEDIPNSGQRLAVGEHYTNVLQDAQKNNQGLLKSSRIGENGVTSDNSLREEHAHYSYFALPNFNKQNAKHILPYDLRIPRNWSDPNIFRIATPIGISLPFLNNSQK